MITELTDLPAGVIGFEVSGTLHAEDYRDVLLPAVKQAAANGKLRAVIVLPDLHGVTPNAMWEDLKLGAETLRSWQRIALVTDISWLTHMTSLLGWMVPGQMERFSLADRAKAIDWAAAER